ncbi:MAG: cell division protein FtsZ [bacterium]|nr:cell division protein FtsZ [bacterium]
MTENMYQFDLPTHHKSIIKVIGVGGGGSNAVNHMYNLGIKDVEFVVCNTDSQALLSSPVPNKLQIGINLTSGLGAGANPEKGKSAALESKEDIRDMLGDGTKMVFITAGMGGGTGTGAAPVIAQVARELDILTVGIVTVPFAFEGKKKMAQAEAGADELKKSCDTVLVILNDKLRVIFGNLSISDAFAQADNVLTTAAKGIAEIITVPGYVNVDFEDVKTVMKNSGAAVMGSAKTSGESRAKRAAEEAINSPLLNNQNINGAQKILLSIISGEEAELQMDELTDITDFMQEFAGDEAEVIFGHGVDPDLGDSIRVTVIATGFDHASNEEIQEQQQLEQPSEPENLLEIDEEPEKKVFDLESNKQIPLFIEKNPEPSKDFFADDEEDTLEEESYSFDFIPKTPKKEEETDDFTFDFTEDLIDEYDVVNDKEEEEDAFLEELDGMAHPPSKKILLMEQARQRVEKLKGLKKSEPESNEDFKERLDVPAYLRKKVELKKVPHSTERNISKYNLNDDNHIIGNNKFLHDNVD